MRTSVASLFLLGLMACGELPNVGDSCLEYESQCASKNLLLACYEGKFIPFICGGDCRVRHKEGTTLLTCNQALPQYGECGVDGEGEWICSESEIGTEHMLGCLHQENSRYFEIDELPHDTWYHHSWCENGCKYDHGALEGCK